MDPAILLIIVFIVAPLIERLLKAGKNPQLPPQQQPRVPLPPQQQRHEQDRPEPPVVIARREQETAADMLPDDLWEILTGQKRLPETPAPAPADVYVEEADMTSESIEGDEIVTEPPPPARWRSAELDLPTPADFSRPVPARLPPQVVSMEKLEFDSRKRHQQFHDRLDRIQAPAQVQRPMTGKVYRFKDADDVRRAFVMSVILGPPKGLE